MVILTPIERETLHIIFEYFKDAQNILIWQYGRHLCHSPTDEVLAYSKTQNYCSRLLNAIFVLLSPSGKPGQLCAQAFP
jgi:hypothetical protein